MPRSDRPRFRINADRQSASRRVRYVETNHPDEGECTICILDELAEVAENVLNASSDPQKTTLADEA